MVLGIFYFDFTDLGNGVTCDLDIPHSDFDGYKIAASNPDFQYLPREVLEKYIP
jgi:hypothetical protein